MLCLAVANKVDNLAPHCAGRAGERCLRMRAHDHRAARCTLRDKGLGDSKLSSQQQRQEEKSAQCTQSELRQAVHALARP